MWQTLIRLRKIWSEKRRALLSNNFHLISFNLYPDVKWSLLLWSAAFQDQIDYQTIHSSCSYSEFSPFLKVFKGNVKSLYWIMYTPSCSRGKSAQLRSRLQFRWSIDVFPFGKLHLSTCCSEVRTSLRCWSFGSPSCNWSMFG
jgi:hypothetical protein